MALPCSFSFSTVDLSGVFEHEDENEEEWKFGVIHKLDTAHPVGRISLSCKRLRRGKLTARRRQKKPGVRAHVRTHEVGKRMGTNECAAKGVDAPSCFHLPSVLRRLPVRRFARFFLSVRPSFPLCCKKLRCAPSRRGAELCIGNPPATTYISCVPEKASTEIARPLREQFEKGRSALSQNNLDYALSLFCGVLQKEPGFLVCREALRQAQLKKAAQGSSNFLKKVIGTASSSPLLAKAQLQIRSNPLEAIATAEQILNADPRNSLAHRTLADAALAADLPRTAVLSLEVVRAADPADKDASFALADALVAAGDTARAELVMSEVAAAHPNDQALAMRHKNMVAKHTLEEKGYEQLSSGKGSYRDVLKNKEEALFLEQAAKARQSEDHTLRLLHELEAQLQEEPRNLKKARNIAELAAQLGHYEHAISYYNYILSASGDMDPGVERAITETTLKKFDAAVNALDKLSPDFEAQKAQLDADRRAFLLADTQRRAAKYPTDAQIRFELGVLFFEAGQLTEAIQEFQKSQAHPNRRIASMGYLGRCFARGGKLEMAARKLGEAIKEKPLLDDEKKELIYNLGSVFEELGRREDAVKQFELIYQEDIGYRDVQKRVDSFYSGSGATA